MTPFADDNLPPELLLALSHTQVSYRPALRIFFELDLRFARILSGTSEPMLGQMRLAWWRDTLSKPVSERPTGDAVLDAIAQHWVGREGALIELANGWEHLLAEPPLNEAHATSFANGRIAGLKGVFEDQRHAWERFGAEAAAWHWAIADLATKVSLAEEREMLVKLALEKPKARAARMPFKGLAVLEALALRSLHNGGRPLMEGRGAALVALRAAFFGR